MLKLYGNPYSRANRVRWTLAEAEVNFIEETVELGEGGTRSAAFMSLNPNGRVPVITDGALTLFESVPIALYVAKAYAPTTLYASDVADEARILQWSVWAMTELERQIERASLHVTWLPENARRPAEAEAAAAEIERCLAMLDAALADGGYLVAGRFTVADVVVTEVLTNIVHAGVPLTRAPRVADYVRRNLARSAAQRSFAGDVIAPFV